MTEDGISSARYLTLRDYLAVVRRYRVMIAIIAIIGAGAGFANAVRQKPVYQATAEVGFQDPTQDLSLVGFGPANVQSPGQLAAVNADTATAPPVMNQVRRQLMTSLSAAALGAATSTQVALSGLLNISSKGSTPTFAAQLANAVANVLVTQDNRQTRSQFTQVANAIRGRISRLKPQAGSSPAQLAFYEDELARLDTLSVFAKSAQLEKSAQTPGGPISPNKPRDTVIGVVLGFLLGLIAAFVRDSLDRRLRKPADFESTFELPVIGYVRNQSMGRVAYLSNGAGEPDQLDLESFRILRRKLEFLHAGKAPKSVLVTSAVAEEGKTTVASSLALVTAATGKLTLLVDCDLRRPDVAGRLGVEPSPGISEYLAGAASAQEVLRTVTFDERPVPIPSTSDSPNGAGGLLHNLVCIPAGSVTSRGAELLGSRRFREFLEQVRETYEVVILDSSPLLPVADTLEMLPHVESMILCARESQTTRDQARAVKAVLERLPNRPTGMVVTGIKPRGAEYEAYAYSYSYS